MGATKKLLEHMTSAERYAVLSEKIEFRNPLEDAALIVIGKNGEELYREVGYGENKRRIVNKK